MPPNRRSRADRRRRLQRVGRGETDNIVIRGVDRQTIVLDGEHSEEMANGIIVFSNGVAVENLTVKNYFSNGVFFTGDYDSDFILRLPGDYVNALNNRVYGIYAFNAEYGLIDNTYLPDIPTRAITSASASRSAVVEQPVGIQHARLLGTNAGGTSSS